MPRVLTYNVHRCVGTDRKLDVGRIAGVIAGFEPDIVALQELDVGRARTGLVDQAHEIAGKLEMAFHFHPALTVEEELYGDAILTRYSQRLVQAAPLPSNEKMAQWLEPRGALWTEIDVGGHPLQVINTHLGLTRKEQLNQAEALAGEAWLSHPRFTGSGMLLGDFNASTASSVFRILTGRLRDAREIAETTPRATSTFPAGLPVLKIDHVFVTPGIRVTAVQAPSDPLIRQASDHLPLVVDFELPQ
jgi:endonuclease/exonuclease/phosphatase family metal-dependent hydrolase